MKNGTVCTHYNEKNTGRDQLLKVTYEIIATVSKRLKNQKFKPAAGDNAKLGYYRVLLEAVRVYNGILRDGELEEINARLAALEAKESGNIMDAQYKEVEPCED